MMTMQVIVINRLSQEEREQAILAALRVLLAKLKERRISEESREKEKVAA